MVVAPNHGGDPLGSILGPKGSHWVQKMGQNVENYHAPNFEFSTTPRSSIFPQKWKEVNVMAPNRGGDPIGSILVPMGSHWVEKMGQNRKNYHAPKFEFSTTPRSSVFLKKLKITVMAPNHGGDPLGSILGPMGSHWVQEMGQNVKNYNTQKFEFSTTPRSSIFPQKWKLPLWRQIAVGTP